MFPSDESRSFYVLFTRQSTTVPAEPFGYAQESLVEAQSTRSPFDRLRANGVAYFVAGLMNSLINELHP